MGDWIEDISVEIWVFAAFLIAASVATGAILGLGQLNKADRNPPPEPVHPDQTADETSESEESTSERFRESRRVMLNEVPQGAAKRDPVVSDSSSESSDDPGEGETGEASGDPSPEAGQLTAGRWSDLENWGFWRGLFGQNQDGESAHEWPKWEERWGLQTRTRIGVRVETETGAPAVDAPIELRTSDGEVVWRARTDNRGRAELFEGLFGDRATGPLEVVVTSGSHRTARTIDSPPAGERLEFTLPDASTPERALDLMFVVDTTGSMGDEIEYLQSELGDVIDRSSKYFGDDVAIRTSVNVYRDTGDDYVVKTHPFRTQADRAVRDLDDEEAAGGGNYPEAVDRALAKSIRQHDWRDRATARLLFLVLDAPAHDREETLARYHEALRAAAERGVRIVPVAGSGVDKPTEFLLRSTAIATGGTYTFLTDDSGIGGSHIEPTIGDHEVHKLNDLLVTIVHDYTKPVGR